MITWIKALLIGVVLVAAALLVPVIMAFLGPILLLAGVIGLVWFVLKLCEEDEPPTDPPP